MELKINNKLVAYNGCIGRRDYILNMLYLGMIMMTLVMPMTFWQMTKAGTVTEMYNFKALLASAPVFVSFFYFLACAIGLVIGSGLVLRRLTDIFGANKPPVYVITTIICLAPYIWVFCMNPLTALFYIIVSIVGIVIMCVPGKISGQFPHDPIKRFNWGAFWGTWIWGLFNKSFITLWALPLLLLPPIFFYFSIICGMKGNEWAYKKNNTVDVKAFHRGQRHQAIGWNIFAGLMIFVLPFLLIFLISAYIVTAAVKNPEAMNNFMDKTESFLESYYNDQFKEYSLDVDENRFYVEPETWVTLTFEERYNLLKSAAMIASIKKKQGVDEKFEGYSGTTYSEMEITKIYSSYNGEVLGEYNFDAMSDVKDLKGAFSAAMKSVKFNTNPTLPSDEEE